MDWQSFGLGMLLTGSVSAIISLIERRGCWHGIAWGGADTDHPGWWLFRNKRIFAREWKKL